MSHYHLATVVKFDPSSFQKTSHTKFKCLHQLTKQEELNSLELLFIYAHQSNNIPNSEEEFLLADFKYKEGSKIVRAKVLCPILNRINWIKINDNLYKVPITNVQPIIRGLTGCSPKGYAYSNQTSLYKYEIDNVEYAAMYCFPDNKSCAMGPYFAFCKIDGISYSKTNHEWNHGDDFWNNGQFISHENVTPFP
ncbi:MAG: hypothetical protein IPO37_20605 [Saprospiraceae bacterium]|nr:hypothetical protein [Saprospiraceae bacterium]